jgi:hypothetical protein
MGGLSPFNRERRETSQSPSFYTTLAAACGLGGKLFATQFSQRFEFHNALGFTTL